MEKEYNEIEERMRRRRRRKKKEGPNALEELIGDGQ